MINQAAIMAWKDNAPWVHAAMVEQDPMEAYEQVRAVFIEQLPGKRE